MLQSSYGILVVNLDSAVCGNVIAALFPLLCKDLFISPTVFVLFCLVHVKSPFILQVCS